MTAPYIGLFSIGSDSFVVALTSCSQANCAARNLTDRCKCAKKDWSPQVQCSDSVS